MVLKSLRFCSEGEVDAYHFSQESSFTLDFPESEYGENNTIARELTPFPTPISKFEDNEIQTTTQDDDSELEDEAGRGKPERWTNYSESGDVEIGTRPQQSASDMDDEAYSPEPRELFTISESDEEVEDAQFIDGPAKADSAEPRQLSPVHLLHREFDNERQDDEPHEAESPEPRWLFPFRHESPAPKYEDDEKDDESLRSASSEPRRLFPVHQFDATVYDPQQTGSQMETYCPAPLRRFSTPEERLEFDAFEDCFVRMHMSKRTDIGASLEKFISETSSPEPPQFFPVPQSHSRLNEPKPNLECGDEALERMEFIAVESLRVWTEGLRMSIGMLEDEHTMMIFCLFVLTNEVMRWTWSSGG